MDAELGPNHERTLTTARNIMKSNKTVLDVKAEYRFLWTTYIPTIGGKKGKKKKSKKKKWTIIVILQSWLKLLLNF